MFRSWLFLLPACFFTTTNLTFSQTIPPQLQSQLGTAPDARHLARTMLESEESALRFKETGELFRAGAFSQAVEKLRGEDSTVRFDGEANPQETAVAQALLALADGDLRGAFDKADSVHRAGKREWSNVDAGLVKSLVYVRAKVAPSALYYADWVREVHRDNNGAAGIRQQLAAADLGAFTLVAKSEHPWQPDYRVVLWRGSETSPQPLAATFMGGSRFIGALTVEEVATDDGKPPEFVIVFRDLDGPPITLESLGRGQPSEDALKEFAGQFCPAWESGRFSVLRAEAESLRWRQWGVTPFAAQWATHALDGGSRIAEKLRTDMQQTQVWDWKLEKTEKQESWTALTYSNQDAPSSEELPGDGLSLEYACVVVLSSDNHRFLDCCVVRSEQLLSGDRVFGLERRGPGRREVLELYDDLPDLVSVTETVVARLQ